MILHNKFHKSGGLPPPYRSDLLPIHTPFLKKGSKFWDAPLNRHHHRIISVLKTVTGFISKFSNLHPGSRHATIDKNGRRFVLDDAKPHDKNGETHFHQPITKMVAVWDFQRNNHQLHQTIRSIFWRKFSFLNISVQLGVWFSLPS